MSPAKTGAGTMATESGHNGRNHHDDRPEHDNAVLMRRDPNEPREQKERPLSISQRIKQLQSNAGLDKEVENVRKLTRRQNVNRPFTTIGNATIGNVK